MSGGQDYRAMDRKQTKPGRHHFKKLEKYKYSVPIWIPDNLPGSVQKDKARTQRPDCKPDGAQESQGEVWNKITNLSRS